MQESRAGSTLELVVNEQQMQNMSQIDLSRQGISANNLDRNQNGPTHESGGFLTFDTIKRWPGQFRDSMGAKVDEAKAKSDSRLQFIIELIRAFSGLFIWLLCFVCTIIVPILLLFVGLLNLDGCATSPSLPYYIFTIGFVMTASNLFNLALALDLPILANHRLLASDIKSIIASILNIIFNSIVAFVYVLTAYRVFTLISLQRTSTDEEATSDGSGGGGIEATETSSAPVSTCNETLLSVSFWFIALTLGLFLAISLLGALLFAYNRYRLAIIRGSAPRSHSHQTEFPGANQTANMSPRMTSTTNRL